MFKMTLGLINIFLIISTSFGVHSISSQGSTLDLSELQSIQYNVEILDTPVEDSKEDAKDQVIS